MPRVKDSSATCVLDFPFGIFSPAHVKYPENYGQVVLSANAPPKKPPILDG